MNSSAEAVQEEGSLLGLLKRLGGRLGEQRAEGVGPESGDQCVVVGIGILLGAVGHADDGESLFQRVTVGGVEQSRPATHPAHQQTVLQRVGAVEALR
jgi:hypothetical protein